MKKFKGMKSLETIIAEAKAIGWEVDTRQYDQGSDWFWLRDIKRRMLQICVNGFNGSFYVYSAFSGDAVYATESSELDEKWYNEILELLYVTE